MNGHVEEMYTGHRIVKAFGHESESIAQFNALNEKLYDAGWRAQFISGIIHAAYELYWQLGLRFGMCYRRDFGDTKVNCYWRHSSVYPVCPSVLAANYPAC